MRDVFVSGVYTSTFGNHESQTHAELAADAAAGALDDAGLTTGDVEYVAYSNVFAGWTTGQESLRGEMWARTAGLQGLPLINVENACASGSTAFHAAWMAIGSGLYDAAVVIGVEKMNVEDRSQVFRCMESGIDLEIQDALRREIGADTPDSPKSLMMAMYASGARRLMERSDVTPEVLAEVVVKNRRHASLNPIAQFRTPTTVEEVLSSRMVADPLTLHMCCPFTDGASALVLTSEEHASKSGYRPTRVLGCSIRSGEAGTDTSAIQRSSSDVLEQHSIGPWDLSLIELHDATAFSEVAGYEQLGLCEVGDAARLVSNGDTALGGALPVNVSGGAVAKGHPVGATGCAQIAEIVSQLRGSVSNDRLVEGAHTGLAVNSGGYLYPDDAAVTVSTLIGV